MASVLKSFRLDSGLVEFIRQKSKELGVSEAKVVESSLKRLVSWDDQWKQSLKNLAGNEELRSEMDEMAEEYYGEYED